MNGAHKDVRAVLTRLEKLGYTLRHGGSGAVGLLDKDNQIVRFPLGAPLLIHLTPGSDKSLDGLYNSLKKCGIELEREEKEMNETNSEQNKREIKRNELKAQSHVLRERLKKLMIDYDITQADFYHFAEDYATTHDIPQPKGPQTLVSGFLRGTDLSDQYVEYMSRSIAAIEQREGKIPKGRRMGAKQPKRLEKEIDDGPVEPRHESIEDEDEPRDAEGLPDAGYEPPAKLLPMAIDSRRIELALRIQSLLYRSLLGDVNLTPDEIDKITQEIAGV